MKGGEKMKVLGSLKLNLRTTIEKVEADGEETFVVRAYNKELARFKDECDLIWYLYHLLEEGRLV